MRTTPVKKNRVTTVSITKKRKAKRPNDEKLREIVLKNAGIKNRIAIACGVSSPAVERWQKDPKFAAWLVEAKEATLDLAESKLLQAIGKGESWAICFYLKCQGKPRGWNERAQIDVSGTVQHDHQHMHRKEEPRDEAYWRRVVQYLADAAGSAEELQHALLGDGGTGAGGAITVEPVDPMGSD